MLFGPIWCWKTETWRHSGRGLAKDQASPRATTGVPVWSSDRGGRSCLLSSTNVFTSFANQPQAVAVFSSHREGKRKWRGKGNFLWGKINAAVTVASFPSGHSEAEQQIPTVITCWSKMDFPPPKKIVANRRQEQCTLIFLNRQEPPQTPLWWTCTEKSTHAASDGNAPSEQVLVPWLWEGTRNTECTVLTTSKCAALWHGGHPHCSVAVTSIRLQNFPPSQRDTPHRAWTPVSSSRSRAVELLGLMVGFRTVFWSLDLTSTKNSLNNLISEN